MQNADGPLIGSAASDFECFISKCLAVPVAVTFVLPLFRALFFPGIATEIGLAGFVPTMSYAAFPWRNIINV